MAAKTNKKSNTGPYDAIVDMHVIRTVDGAFLNEDGDGFTRDLGEADAFWAGHAAADAARAFNAEHQDKAQTLHICKVKDAEGSLVVLSYVYVGTDDEPEAEPVEDEPLPPAPVPTAKATGTTFTFEEQKLLRTFMTLAEKAGKAAAGACTKAQLTQGEHEALTLQGNAEEARVFLDKAEGGAVAFSRGHIEALRTGASLYIEALTKSEQTDEALLLDVSDHDIRRSEAAALARRLGGGDLFDAPVEITP